MKISFRSQGPAPETARVRYAAAKRPAVRWRWYLLLAAIASPVLFFIGSLLWSGVVALGGFEIPGRVFASEQIVRASAPGAIVRIVTSVGSRVAIGTAIATIADPSLEADQAMARAQAKETLPLPVTPRANPAVALQRAQLARAEADVAMYESLAAQGAATFAEVRSVRAQRDAIAADVAGAGPRVDVADADALRRRTLAQVQLRVLDARARASVVRAEVRGIVQSISARPGDVVRPGDPIVSLQVEAAPSIVAELGAKDAKFATVGRRVAVLFGGNRAVAGHITGFTAMPQGNSSTLQLTIALDDPVLPSAAHISNFPVSVKIARNSLGQL